MMLDVVLGGFMRMMRCMNAMGMGGMGMMPGFLVMAGGVMLGGFLVVMRRVLVMLCCGFVMFFVLVRAHIRGSLVLA
jgi:hypothetical protein